MRIIYQNILFLFVGLIFGLRLSEFFKYKSLSLEEILPSENIANTNTITTTISLYNQTRILCWILTGPKRHKSHAIHVKNTWGKRCNKLLFISSELDDQLETIPFSVPEGHDNLWFKTREAFKYIYDNHFDDADWFLKTDDDTYVIMENLREFLYPMSTQAPVYFGYKFQKEGVKQGYMAGGAYVLSKEALYRFATKAYNNDTTCKHLLCLENIGVVAGDSRDQIGSNRFFPMPHTLFYADEMPHWYWNYQFYPESVTTCCSDSAISFHYFTGPEMYSMEYLLYSFRLYGLARNFTLPKKFDMDALMDKWKRDKPLKMTNGNVTNKFKMA